MTSATGCAATASGIVRELTLQREHRRHPLAPEALCGGEDPRLVVDEHVTLGRVPQLDVTQLELLVDVDENVPVDRACDPGALDLVRLEDRVPVSEDYRRPERAKPCEHV